MGLQQALFFFYFYIFKRGLLNMAQFIIAFVISAIIGFNAAKKIFSKAMD